MIKISRRLQHICDMVPAGVRICDVGCDHAYADIRLLQEQKAVHALAMDVAEGPLAMARANLELTELLEQEGDAGRTGRCELRRSDGLAAYEPGEADVLICAGMGGILMRCLLEAEPEKALSFREMILSPHREVNLVREWLFANDCRIAEERFFQDEGQYYTVMRVLCPGQTSQESAGQRHPDWRGLEERIEDLPEEVLARAMVDRGQLIRILGDAAFARLAEENWGPCILADYLSFTGGSKDGRKEERKEERGAGASVAGEDSAGSSSAECFDRFVRERLCGRLRLLEKLGGSEAGDNTQERLREVRGEIGILQTLLAAHRLCGYLQKDVQESAQESAQEDA